MVLEKMEHNWQKVRFCHLRTHDLCDLVHGVGQRSPDLPTIISHHSVVHLLQLFGPIRWTKSLKDCWEIIGAVIDDVIVDLKVGLRAAHFQIIVQEILVHGHLADDRPVELISCQLYPFRLIFGQLVKELHDGIEFHFFTRYL